MAERRGTNAAAARRRRPGYNPLLDQDRAGAQQELVRRSLGGASASPEPSTVPDGSSEPGINWRGKRVGEYALDELWLESQPRELVPEEQLQRLIREDRARPAELLEALRWSASSDSYYQDVLDGLEGLGASIAAQGVLQPIEIVAKAGRYVIRDGHRRSLASLLAGKLTVPGIEVEEPTELEALARPLVLNLQREDLTAIEKAAALLRLALVVGRREAEAASEPPPTIEAILGEAGDEGSSPDTALEARSGGQTIAGGSRGTAKRIRERVCQLVGISRDSYYRLMTVNRLSPQVRSQARPLSETQLRAIVRVPAEYQAEVIDLTRRLTLNAAQTEELAGAVRRGDRAFVRRLVDRAAPAGQQRSRTPTTWAPLLHAVPLDYERRILALRAEVAALEPTDRAKRLEAIGRQMELLLALHAEFAALVRDYTDG